MRNKSKSKTQKATVRTRRKYDFLIDMAVDPEALAAFRRDPEATLAEAGLSKAERQALRKGSAWPICTHPKKPVCPHPKTQSPAGVTGGEALFEWPVCPQLPGTLPHPKTQLPPSVKGGAAVIEQTGGPLDKEGLTVVGLGIRSLQTTPEARVCIEQASKVLYLAGDPVSEAFICRLNPTAQTLDNFYQKGKARMKIYNRMVEKILSCLEKSGDLCVVFYGHPGVLCYPGLEAVRRARLKGVSARMLPGVSAEDNLIADLGIETASLQSYEATAFLIYGYRFDTSAGLLLWQLDVLGETRWNPPHKKVPGRLKVLVDYLAGFYGRHHHVYLYRAAEIPIAQPLIKRLPLSDLAGSESVGGSTLYVPHKGLPNLDSDMVKKLGMEWGAQ